MDEAPTDEPRSRILFLTSNGAGLGHLTRSLAIGRRLPASVDMTIFTLSQAAPIVAGLGVPTEWMFAPGYGGTSRREWNGLYRQRVEAHIDEYEPSIVSFDGTYPYAGLVTAIRAHPQLTWVWCRRAMWKAGTGDEAISRARHFDEIVEPGEFAADDDPGVTVAARDTVHQAAPVVHTDADELLDRAEACASLGIHPDGPNILVQLGAGNINQIGSTSQVVVTALLQAGATVVVPVSPIATSPPDLPEGVHVVSRYPLAPLFRAFDASVAASGYNSFHELLHHRVPSLFVPNEETRMDDQVARAAWADREGVALMARGGQPHALTSAVDRLLDAQVRAGLADACVALGDRNGADELARVYEGLATVSG